MFFLLRLIAVALALLIATKIVPGITVDSFYIAIIVAVLLGLLNITLKPILVVLTLPITILTLGLFLLVINTLILWFLSTFIDGFSIATFWSAFGASLFLSIISWFSHRILK